MLRLISLKTHLRFSSEIVYRYSKTQSCFCQYTLCIAYNVLRPSLGNRSRNRLYTAYLQGLARLFPHKKRARSTGPPKAWPWATSFHLHLFPCFQRYSAIIVYNASGFFLNPALRHHGRALIVQHGKYLSPQLLVCLEYSSQGMGHRTSSPCSDASCGHAGMFCLHKYSHIFCSKYHG